jgi:hypothetical protein
VDGDIAAAEDIVAACFYEVEQPQGTSAHAGSSKLVGVTERGNLSPQRLDAAAGVPH